MSIVCMPCALPACIMLASWKVLSSRIIGADRVRAEQDLERRDAALAVGRLDQLLGDDADQALGEHAADLRLLVGRERR